MLKDRYKSWLMAQEISSFNNYVSRIETLERFYGNIDEYYNKDGCRSLLAEFEYTADDRQNRREPKHKIKITPTSTKDQYKSYYEGTKDYSSRISKYIEFRESIQDEQLGENFLSNTLNDQENHAIHLSTEKSTMNDILQLKRNIRYKGNPIGNAQNFAIRTILSNLGNESFSEKDWEETKCYFEGACAYCGETNKEIVRDHAIPISRNKLGEHRLGNLIPACKDCNDKKGERDYFEFCDNNETALNKIRRYMESRNYIPLTENAIKSKNIRIILHKAHEEIRIVAEKYIELLNDLFFNNLLHNEKHLDE